jgi:hypothetical protein
VGRASLKEKKRKREGGEGGEGKRKEEKRREEGTVIILAMGSRYLNKMKLKRREGRRERKREREKKEGKKGRFAFNNYRGRVRIPGPGRIF